MKKTLDFMLTRKQLLNANDSSKGNWRVKMGVVKYLRELSFQKAQEMGSIDSHLFSKVIVTTVVFPPTRRRVDPPNFAGTTKAIIDGLTDAGWWEDDDFRHVLESRFRYGGLSGEKDKFRIIVEIEEIPEELLSTYVVESEKSDLYPEYPIVDTI